MAVGLSVETRTYIHGLVAVVVVVVLVERIIRVQVGGGGGGRGYEREGSVGRGSTNAVQTGEQERGCRPELTELKQEKNAGEIGPLTLGCQRVGTSGLGSR